MPLSAVLSAVLRVADIPPCLFLCTLCSSECVQCGLGQEVGPNSKMACTAW